MRRLLFRLLQEMEQHHDTVLVCIVEESGSAPRGTGAWMLVNGTGRVAGTIGGGRLELRSIETAMVLLEKCRSLLKHFALNLTDEPDSLGMACGGDVTVLFQRIPWDSGEWRQLAADAAKALRENLRSVPAGRLRMGSSGGSSQGYHGRGSCSGTQPDPQGRH